MSDSNSLAASAQPDAASSVNRLGTAESRALLRECFLQYRTRLVDMARSSLDLATDLFEYTRIPDAEVDSFRMKRGAWVERFGATIDDMYEKRIAGHRRKGRRPDAAAQGLGVKMLTDDDHKMQSAITDATLEFQRFVRLEAAALDQRVNVLMPDRTSHEIDNPFSPPYVLDAIGVTSRAVYSEPLVWRALMQRLITDLTPGVNKIYIAQNRFLADHGVLPEMNAAIRARSEFRPDEDAELLPVFKRLLAHAGDSEPVQLVAERGTLPKSTVVASIAALAKPARPGAGELAKPGARVSGDNDAFPDLDPLLALGSVAGSIKMLTALQRHELARDIVDEAIRAYGAPEGARVPRNLVPSVREALGDTLAGPDQTTTDVIALFFDYMFRDVSIPERMRQVIGRLQIPILKAALIDPSFFHNAKNSARCFLDELAAASVGANGDESYAEALEVVATDAIDTLAERFEIDIAVFDDARAQIARVVEGERKKAQAALESAIAAAAGAEKVEAERGRVRSTVRDRLAGLEVPGAVRAFAETIWTDYLTQSLKEHGEHGVATAEALRTLDDLVWSVAAKERTGQKQRLAKMIPGLVMALRKGCTTLDVPSERLKAFLDELYNLHIAAIKVPGAGALPGAPAAGTPRPADAQPSALPPGANLQPRTRMVLSAAHDFVAEMVPGTWLEFRSDAGPVPGRLAWTGALRMRYVFASRSGAHTFVRAPEELVHALVTGPVALLLEPVPLFDRAISEALNVLAARGGAGAAPLPAA
jgi:hypothetical protein